MAFVLQRRSVSIVVDSKPAVFDVDDSEVAEGKLAGVMAMVERNIDCCSPVGCKSVGCLLVGCNLGVLLSRKDRWAELEDERHKHDNQTYQRCNS